MEPALLTVDGLTAGYGKIQVIWGASLRVERGETVALIGPNGAGKSTILRAIAGLLAPSGGRIVFARRAIGGRPAHQVARLGLALVPEGREIFPALSVHETLLVGGRLAGSRRQVQERLERVYAAFPVLEERRRQRAVTLSGGEQQMLAIGRALMAGPTLLMLDEPSTGLAPVVVDRIAEVLRTLPAQGTSVLLVEQNVPLALELADRAYVLERGRVVLAGEASRLRDEPLIREAYLGLAAGS